MARSDETGNCTKCAHQAEIAAATTDAERTRLQKICLRCIRGCDKCEHGKRKDALDGFIDMCDGGKSVADLYLEKSDIRKRHCEPCKDPRQNTGCRNCPFRERIDTISLVVQLIERKGVLAGKNKVPSSWNDGVPTRLDALKERNRITYEVCTKCRKAPFTDDCAPHGGKEVVAFEAAENPDSILEYADPFAFQHDKKDFRHFDETATEQEDFVRNKVTKQLTAAVEERLKIEISNFGSKLDMIDRELVFFILHGGHLKDFGSMQWAQKYMQKLTTPMTKQAIHNRFKKVCHEMPILRSVAHGMIGKGKGGKGRAKAQPSYQQLDMFSVLAGIASAANGSGE